MNLEDWRREDGSIAMREAYYNMYGQHESSLTYLASIEKLGPVFDLGTAAIAIQTAWALRAIRMSIWRPDNF